MLVHYLEYNRPLRSECPEAMRDPMNIKILYQSIANGVYKKLWISKFMENFGAFKKTKNIILNFFHIFLYKLQFAI